MLSDNSNQQSKSLLKSRRGTAAEGRWWSDNQKLECVKTYLMTGNLAMTARILKVPEPTLRRWAASTWWVEIVDDLRTQDELQLSTRLQKIVSKTLDVIEDRLEHGDYVYDQKTGAMRRKPVALRDAHKVGLDLDAKRDLILQRQAPRASEEQIDDKLLKLAKSFAEIVRGNGEIVNGRKDTSEAIDVPSRDLNNEGENIYVETKVVSNEAVASEIYTDDGEEPVGEFLQEGETSSS